MLENTEKKTRKKGTSATSIAVQRLKETQLNLVFGALKYEELKRIKTSLDTAIRNKKEEEKAILQKKLDELNAE